MQDRAWDRVEQAQQAKQQIWRFVSAASSRAEHVLPLASTLLDLPSTDIRFLAALHLLLSPEASRLVDTAPTLLRQLTTSTTSPLHDHPDRVVGPVDWAATLALSAARGRRAYATRPSTRDYDTPENRLLFASLRAIYDAAGAVSWAPTETGVGVEIRDRATAAFKLGRVPLLRYDIERLQPRDGGRVRRGRSARRFSTVSDFWQLADRLQRLQDTRLLQEMVENTAMLTTSDGVLLELLVLFDTLDIVRDHGWEPVSFGLVRGQVRLLHRRQDETLTVQYQGASPGMASMYGRVLSEHQIPSSSLRPDLVLDRRRPGHRRRVTVLEVKYRRRAVDAARSALFDLLAYRQVYRDAAIDLSFIGVGWGADLCPHPAAEVMLCTPDRLRDALERSVG